MPYMSKRGRRPAEYASKSSHVHIVNAPEVQDFLDRCELPKTADQITIPENWYVDFAPPHHNPIQHIIAVDGGYTLVQVRADFPSSEICFFQFGALTFSIHDLDALGDQPFIDPDDITKLKQIQRLKFVLPVRNISVNGRTTLTQSVRWAVRNFFAHDIDNATLMDTLKWLVFQEFGPPLAEWILASCPNCQTRSIPLRRAEMRPDATFTCSTCGGDIYLTDVFRLHEAVDDELGAGGVLGYLATTIEQMLIVHLIRLILQTKPALLDHILFIKDGPLAFFGQTANMFKPMRELVAYLFDKHNLFLAGLEKTGAFVEHADQIATKMDNARVLILTNDYIYKYIIPGKADPGNPYGRTTYYSSKVIFKTSSGNMYVISLPTEKIQTHPVEQDLRNLHPILANIEKLKCDMYDDALLPVALVNKLVSLADHPSTRILQRFALSQVHGL